MPDYIPVERIIKNCKRSTNGAHPRYHGMHMSAGKEEVARWCRMFRLLFDGRQAQVALLDLQGRILETNTAWREFGRENGQSAGYNCVGMNYLQVCGRGAEENFPGAKDAYVGLLTVLHAQRPKFTMIYPCHSPTEQRWFRLWVEPQLPDIPAVVVAHYRCPRKIAADFSSTPAFRFIGVEGDRLDSAARFSAVAAKNNVLN